MSEMNRKSPEEYEVYDFLTDDRFINYHFKRNAEDLHFWNQRFIAHPELRSKAIEAQEMLQMLTLTLSESEFREELQKMEKRMADLKSGLEVGGLAVLPGRQPWSRRKKISYFLAAASVLVIGIGPVLFRVLDKPPPLFSISNKNAKPFEFEMKDGTTVRLGPWSTLRYRADFNETERKVYLEGEAAFHVKRDTHHPFQVYADDMVATVLGTIFSIKKHPSDSSVSVELLKGSLKVDINYAKNAESHTIYLRPNERIIYKQAAGTFFKESWNPDTTKNNLAAHLVFKNADFESVARQIASAYGITIVNLGKKKKWHYTAEFTNAEFKDVLDNICIVEGLKSTIKGDSVLLR